MDMDLENIIFILREIIFWSCVVAFFSGILLLGYRKYDVLEAKLAKEVGGIRYKVFPKLESNIYTYHDRLMKKRKLLGWICIAYAVMSIFILRYNGYF
ncbi:hypothetical protein EPN54_02685 [bacterium]|nr:MAG: hypothetical protein EPN54_02685 [bacterium]